MTRPLCLLCLCCQLALAAPPPDKAPFANNLLDDLSAGIEKALHAWDMDEARLLMVQVEALNLQGLALLYYVRGRMAFQLGLYEEAADAFVLAGQESNPGTFLRLAEAGKRFLKTAQRFESAHFVLFVPEGKQAALAGYALETLEAQHAALKEALGFAPREKLRVEVVATARELAELSGESPEKLLNSDRAAFCTFGKMLLLSPSALHGGFAWQEGLAHAYACVAVAQQSRNKAPPWLQEALATYLQGHWKNSAPPPLPKAPWADLQQQMRTSSTLLFERRRDLANPHTARLAFAEGFLLVEYLKSQQGPQALPRLLEKLSQQGDVPRAISELTQVPWAKWKPPFRNATLARRFPAQAKAPQAISNPAVLRALRLGKLYADSQRNQAAAHHYAKAWALEGHHRAAVAQDYVPVLLALARHEEAERVLAQSLDEASAPAALWVSLGKLRLHQSQWAKAQAAFESALAQNPFFPEVHLGLFAAAQAQGNAALAKRAQEAAAILLQTTP